MKKNKENIIDNDKNQEKNLVVKKEKKSRIEIRKIFKQTSLTILLIAIIITACIGINIFVEDANWSDLDFTQDKIYSLSDMSKQIAEAVNEEVKITLINMPEAQVDFANKYNSVNKNIKVEVIDDVTSRTDLMDEYGFTANSYVILVESGEINKILTDVDLYTYDYTTYKQIDTTEEALTNAIIDVTTDKKPIIYNLTGHNKYSSDYFYYFLLDLEDEAYEINDLDLLTVKEVPDDCSVLMITTLAEDITKAEKDSILKYIEKVARLYYFLIQMQQEKKCLIFKKY